MANRQDLPVLLYGRHVADVLDAGFGDTAVRYTAEAMADPQRSRLSLSLPVQHEVHHASGPGGRWVRSLLPEGRALAWAVEHFGIPEDDRYALIAALGGDVAGAVQIVTSLERSEEAPHYELVSESELAEILMRSPRHGLALNNERGIRLSLAGMQDKVLLHQIGQEYYLPILGAPSTLIVKPEPKEVEDGIDLRGLATNELFCLTLAELCGLNAARATVRDFGNQRAIVVRRYDRSLSGDTVVRLHQEDLLGALGLDPLLKYEKPLVERRAPVGGWAELAVVISRKGPRLVDMAALLTEHIGTANLLPFLSAVSFNVAIGNADSHGRNYSVLLTDSGTIQLAPLYDLVSTRLYPEFDTDAAQFVNGQDQIDAVTREDLISEGTEWGVPRQLCADRVDVMVGHVRANLNVAVDECIVRGGDPDVASKVASLVSDRLKQLD